MAKVDVLKKKYPELNVNFNMVDIMNNLDPSSTKKYLPFMVKCSKFYYDKFMKNVINNFATEFGNLISEFHDHCEYNRIENKDINSYKTIDELLRAVETARSVETKNDIRKKQTRKIYEDDEVVIVKPLTVKSSALYGSETKWCVASNKFKDVEVQKHFNQYTENGMLIYIIFKKGVSDANYNRVAVHQYTYDENTTTYWLSNDDESTSGNITKLMKYLGSKRMGYLLNELDRNVPNSQDTPIT